MPSTMRSGIDIMGETSGAIGAAALAVGVGGVYAYGKFQDYKNKGGTLTFWPWIAAGMPASDNTQTGTPTGGGNTGGTGNGTIPPPTVSVNPQISSFSTSLPTPLGNTVIIVGTGFSPNGALIVNEQMLVNGTWMTLDGSKGNNADYGGGAQIHFSIPGVPTATAYMISVTDSLSGVTSNALTFNVQQQAPSNPPPVSYVGTNVSGNALTASKWSGTGAYGDNTNPISFGNWAYSVANVWADNWYGSGYYQNPAGNAEMYFGSPSDAIAWLQGNGYNTIANVVNAQNPATPVPNWGGYGAPLTGSGSQATPWTPDANGKITWNGNGFYYLGGGGFTGITAGVYLITNPAFVASYNGNL